MIKVRKKILFGIFMLLVAFMLASCGVSNVSIKVYTRDTSSGTRDGFFTGIGFKEAKEDNSVLVSGYIEVDSNGSMINAIKNDENGIGYISLASLADSNIKGLNYEGVSPTEENVLNNTYSLTRNFNYCKRAEYKNSKSEQIVNAFISYMSTVEGKATVIEYGGILETSSSDVSWKSIADTLTIVDEDNSDITIYVGGSTSVKSIVSNLLSEFSAKCGNFQYNYNPTGSGDAYKRTNGSEKDGSNYCDIAFASREFSSSEEMDSSLKGKICVDAIVAVVNKNNSLINITGNQLASIYKGEIAKWSDLK